MLSDLEYKLIRQNRKTLSISIKNQILIIKSPLKLATFQIQNFVNEKENWIKKQIKNQKEKLQKETKLNLDFGKDKFWEVNLQPILTKKVNFWLQELQIHNENQQRIEIKIIVKKYLTKWGSCSYFSPKNHSKQDWEISSELNQKIQTNQNKISPKTLKKVTESKNVSKQSNLLLSDSKFGFKNDFCSKDWQKTPKNKIKITNLNSNYGQLWQQKNCKKYTILAKNLLQNPQKIAKYIYSSLKLAKLSNLFQKVQDLFGFQKSKEENINLKKKKVKIPNSKISNLKLYSKLQVSKSQDFLALSQTSPKNSSKKDYTILPNKCQLKFNLRLGYVPEFVLDYVIVHELAHLWEPNHSLRFWKVVESVLDSQNAKIWLKNEGSFYL